MRIDKKYKVRTIADQTIIILQGEHGADTTKVLSLNATSLFLWNTFANVTDFQIEDVTQALINEYKIDSTIAINDANQWIETLSKHNVIISN